MTQNTLRFNHGIAHYSTKDAVFRTLDKQPIAMQFHRFCGPSFELDGEECWIPDFESAEWFNLWKQFDGWMDAKGAR